MCRVHCQGQHRNVLSRKGQQSKGSGDGSPQWHLGSEMPGAEFTKYPKTVLRLFWESEQTYDSLKIVFRLC